MKAATLFSEHVKSENYRLFVVVNYISYLGFFTHLAFIPLFFWINLDVLAYFNFISVVVWAIAYISNRNGQHVKAIVLISIEVFLHATLATYLMGWESGFHYFLIPFILFIFINHKQSLVVIGVQTIAVFLVYLWLLVNTQGGAYQTLVDETVIQVFQFMNIAVNFFAIGLLGYSLRSASMRAEWDMEQLAITDALTGLYNRRKMYEMMQQETTRLQRNGKPGVLVMADIDLFKPINDQYGHDCGDYVLKEVSLLLLETLRRQDVLSRWGGEEFMLLLPETDIEGAVKVIEVLRETIAAHVFEYQSQSISITMTFGMEVFDDSRPIEMVIKRADQLLYKGKEQGRNCTVTRLGFELAQT